MSTGRIVDRNELTEKLAKELQLARDECITLKGLSGHTIFSSVFYYAAIGMALVSSDGRLLKVNKALCKVVGYTENELMQKTFLDITHPDDLAEDIGYVQRMLSGEIETYKIEKRYLHKNGDVVNILLNVSLVRDVEAHQILFISQIQDITKQKQAEEELVRLAREDALTGICNRRCFFELATREIIRGGRFREPSVVLMMDIDNFKLINDTYGHDCGDEVLKAMAHTCNDTLRSLDVFGRLGGEEFGVLLINTDAEVGKIVAERLRANVENLAVKTSAGPIHLTVSIGFVAFVGDSMPIGYRLKQADDALYKAKRAGRNRVESTIDIEELGETFEYIQPGLIRIVWNRSYECGNETIDSQHRRFFEIINDLLSAIVDNKQQAVCRRIIDELIEHSVRHFHDEYEIINSVGYPNADNHSRIHNDLVSSMNLLSSQYDAGELDLGKLFNFLAVDVISKHLLQEDKKFFPYISSATG